MNFGQMRAITAEVDNAAAAKVPEGATFEEDGLAVTLGRKVGRGWDGYDRYEVRHSGSKWVWSASVVACSPFEEA